MQSKETKKWQDEEALARFRNGTGTPGVWYFWILPW